MNNFAKKLEDAVDIVVGAIDGAIARGDKSYGKRRAAELKAKALREGGLGLGEDLSLRMQGERGSRVKEEVKKLGGLQDQVEGVLNGEQGER